MQAVTAFLQRTLGDSINVAKTLYKVMILPSSS